MKKGFLCISIMLVLVPVFQAQYWIQTDTLPRAARYDDVYFLDDMRGWCVSSLGGIYKTTDGGNHWREVLYADTQKYMRCIEFISDSVGLAAPLEQYLFRTTDAGETWQNIADNIPGEFNGLCGLSHIGSHVFGVGVFNSPAYFVKSSDGGLTWSYKDMTEYADGLVEVHFFDTLHGFAGGSLFGGGAIILETTDGGETWEQVFIQDGGFAFVWKLFFINSLTGFGSIESIDGEFAIAKTTDGGDTWTYLPGPAGEFDIQGIGFDTPLHGWVSPRTDSLYETFDGGLSWQATDPLRNINRFFQVPNGRLYASGSQIYFHDGTTAVHDPITPQYYHAISANPNPSSGSFDLEIRIDVLTSAIVALISTAGNQFVRLYDGDLHAGSHTFSVSSAHLAPFASAPVIAVLATDEGFLTTKIIRLSR